MIASLLVMLGYNFARFGSPFAIGYDRLGHLSKIAFDARSPKVLATLVFGPGIGLLVLSPLLLLTFWGLAPLWRRDRAYFVGLTASVVSCYLFFSCWHDSYSGGVAWGTRYQCHLLPLYAVPLTLGIQRLVTTLNGRRLVVLVAAVSLAIQLLSVVVTHHMEYLESDCQGATEEALASDPARGQLARRAQNVLRWVRSAGPPHCDSPESQSLIDVVMSPELVASPREVELVLLVPLSELMADGVFREERWGVAPQDRPIYFFEVVGDTIGCDGRHAAEPAHADHRHVRCGREAGAMARSGPSPRAGT